jgi:hypothetical protein
MRIYSSVDDGFRRQERKIPTENILLQKGFLRRIWAKSERADQPQQVERPKKSLRSRA